MHRGIVTCCTLSVVNKLNLGAHVQSFALPFNNIMLLLFMTWPGGSKVALWPVVVPGQYFAKDVV